MTEPVITFIYASQKGNSEGIAEDFYSECMDTIDNVSLHCISEVEKDLKIIKQTDCAIFIAATTGDGEPPDTARKLWKILNKKKELLSSERSPADLPLSHLSYTVLGMGDTNYTDFCNFGKNLDRQIHNLGAKRFYPCGWADDGTGLELVIEPWREELWGALNKWISDFKENRINEQNMSSDVIKCNGSEKSNSDEVDLTNKAIEDHCVKNGICQDTKMEKTEKQDVDDLSSIVNDMKLEAMKNDDIIDSNWRENHVLLKNHFSPETNLTLPKPPSYNLIAITGNGKTYQTDMNDNFAKSLVLPFSETPVYDCPVDNVKLLTNSDDETCRTVKKVYEISMKLPSEAEFDYQPGDSIGVLARNDPHEVEYILKLLGIENPDEEITLSVSQDSKKALPKHLKSVSSAREIFSKFVDYRCVPKKGILLYLSQVASCEHQKRCLKELACKEGSDLYQNKVLENRLTFLDIISVFRSCQVDLSSVLEFLPRLLPRPYSLTSTPLNNEKVLSFTFSVTEIPKSELIYEHRLGICTGMLSSLNSSDSVKLYLRSANSFRLPDTISEPLIFIGPGTGISPFIGFLRHLKMKNTIGRSIRLYFGCRYRTLDDIYQKELDEFLENSVLMHLHKCYSREENDKKYVQHLVEDHKSDIVNDIVEEGGRVYVCGDAKRMAKDVYDTFVRMLTEKLGDQNMAVEYILQMKKEGRYLQDIWS